MHRFHIEDLYRRMFRTLVKNTATFVPHRADAEDIVQALFVSLLEGATGDVPPAPANNVAAPHPSPTERSTRMSPFDTHTTQANDPDHTSGGPHDELDALIRHAAHGDDRAIGALAVGLGPILLEIVRDANPRGKDEAHVLNDLLHAMKERRAVAIAPAPGHAVAWLDGLLRLIARGEHALCSSRDYGAEHQTPASPRREPAAATRSYVEALHRRSQRNFVRAAHAVVHDRTVAEDIVKEVFVSLLDGDADHLPPGPEVDAFALTAIVRLGLDQITPAPRPNVVPLSRPRPPTRRRLRAA